MPREFKEEKFNLEHIHVGANGEGGDGGQGLVAEFDFRSEEEKLIEEFKEELNGENGYIIAFGDEESGDKSFLNEISKDARLFIYDFILKAYRAGKLAELEMYDDILPEERDFGPDPMFDNECRVCEESEGYCQCKGFNEAIRAFKYSIGFRKSRLEEEKKKL